MTRIFVTGYKGRIGKLMVKRGLMPLECDVTSSKEVNDEIKDKNPDLILHLASISGVDYCEVRENQEKVMKVNFHGALNVFKSEVPVVFISSDHIFDGKKGKYKEYSKPHPVNYYGSVKLAMDAASHSFVNVKIVRASYLFDYARLKPQFLLPFDFPTFISRSFMYTEHFADALMWYISHFPEMPKILNISGSKIVNWYEFALASASVFDVDKKYIYPRRKEWKQSDVNVAPRPHKAGLDVTLSRKLGLPQFSYIDGIKQMTVDKNLTDLGYNI